MENIEDLISKIETNQNPNNNDIQKLLATVQKCQKIGETMINQSTWNNILQYLWNNLHSGLENLDDELLCGTCLYNIILMSDNGEKYFSNIITVIENTDKNHEVAFKVALMYGFFQSSFLLHVKGNLYTQTRHFLEVTLSNLVSMAYDYTRYTFLAFKILTSLKKTINTPFESIVFEKENINLLLNLINHNWENPITGVRDLNRCLFSLVISVTNNDMLKKILIEIDTFNWNKAKYLMLSDIINYGNRICDKYLIDWVDGLLYSLYKPGMVSAGADLYYAVLNYLKEENDWDSLFFSKIIKMLLYGGIKAIENFGNYWYLPTAKVFPSAMKRLICNIDSHETTKTQLLAKYSIWAKANKIGLLDRDWDDELFITKIWFGLNDCSVAIRISSFDIVCVSKVAEYPHFIEYEMVLQYINDNLNSDSTVLRNNILISFKTFLSRIHTVFITKVKNCKSCNTRHTLPTELESFCKRLQQLLLDSFYLDGNYQRKITCLKVCDTFLSSFDLLPNNKRQPKSQENSLLAYIKENGIFFMDHEHFTTKLINLLQDPANDVRDSVMHLLLDHYIDFLTSESVFKTIKVTANEKIQSKFFYEIDCGQTLYNLLVHILIKTHDNINSTISPEDIYKEFYDVFLHQCLRHNDIVDSIQTGKQLHSLLRVISVIYNVSLKYKYKLKNTDIEDIYKLLESLSLVSKQLSDNNACLDFEAMSNMVEKQISEIEKEIYDEKDEIKISGLHQMVLNSIWLNVKECCNLSAVLVRYYSDDNYKDIITKCLEIVTNVLETSRHKGAIEAAGLALGQCIRHLTLLPAKTELSKLPQSLLEDKLNSLVLNSKMASVTRRGAGLSILVHRIVSSDAKKGKPLLHYLMKTLLEHCNKSDSTNLETTDIDNQKDLPKAIFIHFLTKIVCDASLSPDIMFYSAELAQLAFSNLTSKYWQIRNAALQLYGALLPRFIGQNKQSGTENESVATVACDELRTHSPKLWQNMIHMLKSSHTDNLVQAHSDLVPTLTLISNCARRYNFTFDNTIQGTLENDLLQSCMRLIGSPIHTVRRLSGKLIYKIFSFDLVFNLIIKRKALTENELHGTLMLTSFYLQDIMVRKTNEKYFLELQDYFAKLLQSKCHSYLCYTFFEDIFVVNNVTSVQKAFDELKEKGRTHLGIHNWIRKRIIRCLRDCHSNDILKVIQIICSNQYSEAYNIIDEYIANNSDINLNILNDIAKLVSKHVTVTEHQCLWKILYEVSLRLSVDCRPIIGMIENTDLKINYVNRYMLPFFIRTLGTTDSSFDKLVNTVFCLADCEKTDYEMRFIAALSMNEIGLKIRSLGDEHKVMIIKSAILLLQDEDEDIRNESVKFYKNIHGSNQEMNPYICWRKILSAKFLKNILISEQGIKLLVNELENHIESSIKEMDGDDYNPFNSESNNIYIELKLLKKEIDLL